MIKPGNQEKEYRMDQEAYKEGRNKVASNV